MTTIFLIQTRGSLARFSGPGRLLCKKAFTTQEKADDYLPQFRTSCITPISDQDLLVLEDNHLLECFFTELELV